MLTDIFAYRYLEQPIWTKYTEIEKRLLNQAFAIVKDAIPYYGYEGKVNENNKVKWRLLHDRLSRELGIDELSTRYYSYTQKNVAGQEYPVSGWFSWDHVCNQFVNVKYSDQFDADRFIKERISFVELALRLRGEEVSLANLHLNEKLKQTELHDLTRKTAHQRMGLTVPGSSVEAVKAMNLSMNSVYEAQVDELNERFRRAKVPITYHNGFIQFSVDQQIERNIAKPFWNLVADPLWKNVDIDMKEALDRRDSNDKDPSIFAAKALESAVKIVSDAKGLTRGTENGAAQYVDNLMSKKMADIWMYGRAK